MKNSAILKGELSLLNADRSAALRELREVSNKIVDAQALLADEEDALKGIREIISEETARLEVIQGRVVFVGKELIASTQELKNINNSIETARVKYSQETKLHLGRIKELKEAEEQLLTNISEAKRIYDSNVNTYTRHESEKAKKLKELDESILSKENHLKKLEKETERKEAEDKKMTKDRLKREDKVRAREKLVDARELGLDKREEDMLTMSQDMGIMYGRLKELYAKVAPDVDLDKLILNAT